MGRIVHKRRLGRLILLLCASLAAYALWMCALENLLFHEPVKTALLRRRGAHLRERMSLLEHRCDACLEQLGILRSRDCNVYRSIFGMDSIACCCVTPGSKGLPRALQIQRMLCGQALSYNQIDSVLGNAGALAASIPSISPIMPREGSFKISSPYGFREHPVTGVTAFHGGVDFSLGGGSPVFATGDGRIESVRIELHGYGRQLVIDHGFGYKTRYAHLKEVFVTEGMRIHRGDQIATSGNTGLSTGAHLHYEVIYKGNPVNPVNYFDCYIPLDQYMSLVRPCSDAKTDFYIHPMHRR